MPAGAASRSSRAGSRTAALPLEPVRPVSPAILSSTEFAHYDLGLAVDPLKIIGRKRQERPDPAEPGLACAEGAEGPAASAA